MNSKIQAFQDFLAIQSIQVPIWGFLFNLFLAAILGFGLSQIYIRYGTSLSNRRVFAGNFVLLTMTTTLVISIVKSSLALSLGLVGALSIVRFRAAIKEPEELAYLFLTIAIGLGLGANQRLITLLACMFIAAAVWFRYILKEKEDSQNMFLTVTSSKKDNIEIQDIVEVLKRHCRGVSLRRYDQRDGIIEASFLVDMDDFAQLQASQKALQVLDAKLQITFLDHKGIG